MLLAIWVALSISLLAPVETSWKNTSSLLLPPNKPVISAINSFFVSKYLSSSGPIKTCPPVWPRGIIVIFLTLSALGNVKPIIACPASWYATCLLSLSFIPLLDFAGPAILLSIASSISASEISSRLPLTAKIAASFKIFAISAPEKPTVLFANWPKLISGDNFLFCAWTLKIASLPSLFGKLTVICLSKRPALNKAGSRTSALFVAAMTIMPEFSSNPSSSTSNWLRVCSLSSFPPPKPAPLCLPTASISSIKTTQGAFCFAVLKRSLTLPAPAPTNISTKSAPEIEKNGAPTSPATAFANKVLPVPGGPTKRKPFGNFAPHFVYFLGFFR